MQDKALAYRRDNRGLIGVASKVAVRDAGTLALVYTPGVAESCLVIKDNPEESFIHTWRANSVVMLTDGSNIPGLGNVGPEAAMPLMESKAALFKSLAGVDAFPIALATDQVDKIIKTGVLLEPTFGAVFIDGIATPKCLEVVEKLESTLQIPVYHESQHSVPVAVLAGLINALKVVGKDLSTARIVINGAGPAGIATAKLIAAAGGRYTVLCDTGGAIYKGRRGHMTPLKDEVASRTNYGMVRGSLAEAMKGADVFIGLSGGNAVSEEMVRSMATDAVVFALASPVPEIDPALARKAGATVVAAPTAEEANELYSALVLPGF
jgi:malate dehydrogenase (oxaloacetate-decarboxylating)